MAHDELVAKMEKLYDDYLEGTLYTALCAVVELHTPFEKMTGAAWTPSNGITEPSSELYCRHCSNTGSLMPNYPCPTIQAIQKVLG